MVNFAFDFLLSCLCIRQSSLHGSHQLSVFGVELKKIARWPEAIHVTVGILWECSGRGDEEHYNVFIGYGE